MSQLNQEAQSQTDPENEHYPLEPHYHPVNRFLSGVYDFLASSKLAMFLLVAILSCCLVGVTVFRGARAWEMVFDTLWFNGLLVLLVVNVACCFFGRIWGRKVTVISFGMILFHMSFVAMFLGIVWNSLYYFRGEMRITEGEVLQNSDRQSYDSVESGRFFKLSSLSGQTMLNKLLPDYKVGGANKRVAYDVSVIGEDGSATQEVIYLTHNLIYRGVTYLPNREGYSLLTVLADKNGKEIYGAHVPIQSLKQSNGSYIYSTGTKKGVGSMYFPHLPEKPLFDLRIGYRPDGKNARGGDAMFEIFPITGSPDQHPPKPMAEGYAPVGKIATVGDYQLSVAEVRYWVVMRVDYEPGKPVVMGSLWVGLAGMIITTLGRISRKRRRELA